MQSFRTFIAVTAMTAGLFLTALAQAHPKLVSSQPAAEASVAAPATIELHFSENLVTQFSGARLMMTGMQGMSHEPMAIPAKISAGSDPKTMLITPVKPLVPGTYRVEWRAVSSDTHPITGNYSFTVK
ncbi:hypothetical protein IQ22_03894 [Pseudomonas duriflava]|uniref:Copper resistance protein C n=1 Tax=Pseudomonas duriflava TaxID=459528 RepID=A0A562Q214_9PSED|nr:copper homeostasis periplasmic binding protein CopC [Pseudomonas duriflava]TWI50500.1 hypothetical protein IQ22_03894 [Pseudomonas duriflava]